MASNGQVVLPSASGYVVLQRSADPLPQGAGAILLGLARAAIASALGMSRAARDDLPWLTQQAACFVTLTAAEKLRGCIGTLRAHRPLLDDVRANAVAAALR